VSILLDENFPLQLFHRLRAEGAQVEHIILLQERGISDSAIRKRLEVDSELVFLTQDTEFLDLDFECRGAIIVSRVRQGLPIRERMASKLSAQSVHRGLGSSSSSRAAYRPGRSIEPDALHAYLE